MGKTLKIVCLVIGLSAFAILAILGFAIWVFIPLLPAGVIFVIALIGAKRRTIATARKTEDGSDTPKAA